MSFLIENGSGVLGANVYASISFALNYLTERNRQDENGWADLDENVRQAHLIGGTDYIENRFRRCFNGSKEFTALQLAKATLTMTVNPTDTTTVTLGSVVYTFNTVLGGANSVLIDTNTSLTINNLIDAIRATPDTLGTKFGVGTVINPDAGANPFEDDTMVAEALTNGVQGNLIVSTTTVVGATWSSATLLGGTDTPRPQSLSFPRINLFDRDGIAVVGIPDLLKFADVEYAVRNVAAVLQPDPDVTTGLQLIETDEKVDVLQEKKKYSDGGRVQTSIPYPAADSLLEEYLRPAGLVLRA